MELHPEPINNGFLDVAFPSHPLDIGELIILS
jgi:hypothetical protein